MSCSHSPRPRHSIGVLRRIALNQKGSDLEYLASLRTLSVLLAMEVDPKDGLSSSKTEMELERKRSLLGMARTISAKISQDFSEGYELKEKLSSEWIVNVDEDEDEAVRQNALRVAVIGTGWMARALVKVMAEVGTS